MPNLLLPICLKTHLTEYHQAVRYLSIPEESKLITGGANGDLVVWKVKLSHLKEKSKLIEPILYMTTSLTLTAGAVTVIQALKKPILSELEGTGCGILTIHEDMRARIWDISDGRCMNISSNPLFQLQSVTICVPLNPNATRFFAVGGVGKGVEILDVWRMQTICFIPLEESSSEVRDIGIIFEKKEMYLVDDKNILYCIDISQLCSDTLSIYSLYSKNYLETSKQLKNVKCTVISKIKVSSSKDKLKQLIIQPQLPFVMLVYPNKILFQNTDELFKSTHVSTKMADNSQLPVALTLTPQQSSSESEYKHPNHHSLSPMRESHQDTPQSHSSQTLPPPMNMNEQLRLMIQKSDDLLGIRKPPSAQAQAAKNLPKLKEKIKFQAVNTEECSIQSAQVMLSESNLHLIVFFSNANIQILAFSDLMKLFSFSTLNAERDFTFDYSSFGFSKREKQIKSRFNMQLIEILKPSLPSQSSPISVGYDPHFQYFYLFNPNTFILTAYPFESHLSKIHTFIPQLNQASNNEIEQDSCCTIIKCMDLSIQFSAHSLQDSSYKIVDCSSYYLPSPEPCMEWCLQGAKTLFCDEQNIFNSTFFIKYGVVLKEKYKDEMITTSCVDFIKYVPTQSNTVSSNRVSLNTVNSNSLNPPSNGNSLNNNMKQRCQGGEGYQFFGTNGGMIIGLSLLCSEVSEYCEVLHYEFSDKKEVKFLEVKENYLIGSNNSGLCVVFSLSAITTAITRQSTGENKKTCKEKLKVIDLTPYLVFQQVFSSPLKHIISISLLSCSAKEQNNINANNLQAFSQDQSNEAQQFIESSLGFLLQNNSVVIFNIKSSSVTYTLNSNKSSVSSIYLHPMADYLIVLTSDSNMSFWSLGSKRYERSGKLENFLSLFDIDSLFEEKFKSLEKERNSLHAFKEQYGKNASKTHLLLEYNKRYFDDSINYCSDNAMSLLLYEQLGDVRDSAKANKNNSQLLWILEHLKDLIYQSKSEENGTCILKMKLNRVKQNNFKNQASILLVDIKKHSQMLSDILEKSSNEESDRQGFSYVPFVYPWGEQVKKADLSISGVIHHMKPVFNYVVGVSGLGEAFAFSLQQNSQYSTSNYLSSIQALSILLHLMILGVFKDSNLTYNTMLEVANLFTKNKKRVSNEFQNLSLPILARFCIDDSNEVMSSASNLIINSLVYKDEESGRQVKCAIEMMALHLEREKDQEVKLLSVEEITWLLMITYSNIFSPASSQIEMMSYIQRIVSGIELNNCLASPQLVAPCMKILTEGIATWKDMIKDYKELLTNLILIYFHYNTQQDQLDTSLKDMPKPQQKKSMHLDRFLKQQPNIRKRMKLMTIKTLISLLNVSQNEFLTLANKEISNIDRHPLYPCSVIDIIRNYIKVQSTAAVNRLPHFIEIILKSLDPNNPAIRKICHVSAQKALLTIFQIFSNVSYNQASQKFAVGSNQGQILIYDLRTAVKWRVLAGQQGNVSTLSFDSNGKQIASFSVDDYNVRIWKIGSTGFFSSILNINGTPSKTIPIQKKPFEEQVSQGRKMTLVWDEGDKYLQIKIGSATQKVEVN